MTQSKNQLTPAELLSNPQVAPSAAEANLQLVPANPQLPVCNPQLAVVATQANPQPAPADSQLLLANPRPAQIVNPQPALANPQLPRANPQPDPLGSAPPSDAPDPIALKWAAKNPWFGTEMDMTYFAYEVHDQLIEQEGVTADMPEYYTAISARAEAEFPDRFFSSGGGGVQRQGSMVLPGGQRAPASAMYRQNSSLGMGMYRQGSSIGATSPSAYQQAGTLGNGNVRPTLYRQRSTLPMQSANGNSANAPRLYKGSSTVAAMMQQLQQPNAPRLYRGSSTIAADLQQPVGIVTSNRPGVPLLSLQDSKQAISPRQEGPRSSRGVGSLYDQRSGTPRVDFTDQQ